jgi:hypothetical protein
VLEVKLKDGYRGTKQTLPIRAFALARGTSRRTLRAAIVESAGPDAAALVDLDVVLATRYRRRYLASRSRDFRITLDDRIAYLGAPGVRGFSSFWRRDENLVIELKYRPEDRPRAEATVQSLGLRWVRNSKFENGLVAVGSAPSR